MNGTVSRCDILIFFEETDVCIQFQLFPERQFCLF